jgi:hypothetical protein
MDRETDHWQARLPASLRPHVVMPVRVEVHRDDEVPASKWRGYDALGLLCWYRHRFSQWDARFDGDDEPVAHLLREEDFEAWRSLTGPWIRRVQRLDGDGKPCGVASDTGFELVKAGDVPRL